MQNYEDAPVTTRLYQDQADLEAMLAMLMEGRLRTNDWHYAHVGELLYNFFMITCHLDPLQHIRLWHDPQGRLVGFALLGEDPSFDCQVLPEYEWTGIEEQAFAWVETLLAHLRQQEPVRWGAELGSGSRQDDLQRIRFLEAHGFIYSGKFAEVNMLRPLSLPIPEMEIPPGCQVRSLAEQGEVTNRAGAEREVWAPWTVGNITDDDYRRMMRLPGYQRQLDVITVAPDGVIAAYVLGWIDPLNHIGDFGPVGARAAYRRQGLTRLALLESLRRMRAFGMDRVCVSTGLTNTPAINLYQSVGFKPVNRYLDYIQVTNSPSG